MWTVLILKKTLTWVHPKLQEGAPHLGPKRGLLSILLLLLSRDVQSSEVSGSTSDGSGGSGVGIGDRFKIEGRAVVPGVKPQDWISAARVLVDGEEHVGFLK